MTDEITDRNLSKITKY